MFDGRCCSGDVLVVVPLNRLFPSIFLDHVSKLDDKLALFILLTRLERMLVFPPKGGLATFAVNISNSMKASQENSLLCRTTAHVHHGIKEIGTTLTALEGLI